MRNRRGIGLVVGAITLGAVFGVAPGGVAKAGGPMSATPRKRLRITPACRLCYVVYSPLILT